MIFCQYKKTCTCLVYYVITLKSNNFISFYPKPTKYNMKIILSLIAIALIGLLIGISQLNFFSDKPDLSTYRKPSVTAIKPAPPVLDRPAMPASPPTDTNRSIRVPNKPNDNIVEQLFTVSMAFSLPISANIEDDIVAQLLIDPSKTVKELENQLSKQGKKITETIKVSTIVIADIIATDFEVKSITPNEQVILSSGATEWLWILTPKKPGLHSVNLTVSAVVKVGDRESRYQIKTFERSIDVEIKPKQLLENWFSKYWQWLLSTIFIPIIVFFVKRKFFK